MTLNFQLALLSCRQLSSSSSLQGIVQAILPSALASFVSSCYTKNFLYSRTINSFISTSNKSAIFSRLGKSGCDEFVHHLETVDGVTPIWSDSHLLVRFFSTSTSLIRFTSSIIRRFIGTKVVK